ncbi:MAG TPA: DUF433 domain-containing protein [Hanamia sp.]|nr:DUF433 domain-containing protein [Hanamia sp.]
MDIRDQIEVNPKVLMGKPVIKGTRISVESILEKLAAGETETEILQAHPHLNKENIKAALSFAAQSLKGENIYPIAL